MGAGDRRQARSGRAGGGVLRGTEPRPDGWWGSPAPTARPPRPTCWRPSWRRRAGAAAQRKPCPTGPAVPRRRPRTRHPEAPDLQALLRRMVEHGHAACVMEVSSHALSMRRVDRTTFAAAIFTNLTRDHLDYHGDMARYFEAKRRLFNMLPNGAPSIVNLDDPAGRRLAGLVSHPVTYAVDEAAAVRPGRLASTRSENRLDVITPGGRLELRSPMPGRVNVYNLLAAVAAAVALDVPLSAIEQGVAGLHGVPGALRGRVRAGRRRLGAGRLRPYRRRAAGGARGGARVPRRPPHQRLRVRRRSRPPQTPVDGGGGGPAQRSRGADLRQSAVRGSGSHHR